MFNTRHCVKYNSKYTNYCYLIFFLRSFKLKTDVIIDLKSFLVKESNIEVIGLLDFRSGTYTVDFAQNLSIHLSLIIAMLRERLDGSVGSLSE